MKSTIALKLLADQLQWSDDEATEEFFDLQLMIAHKYDEYQGFQPASRFHVSLLNWLSQFPTVDNKRVAFEFIKQRLIFITQREMHHLVSLMMPTLDRLMRKQIAKELGLQLYETWIKESAVRRLKLLRRRTLFVGLSDGAKIDVFRRYNEGLISNEQVVPFSEMSDQKWEDLTAELGRWLVENEFSDETVLFESVCLIDDFAGSGASLLRQEPDGSWKGKIQKFYIANKHRIGVALSSNWKLYAHHHLASQQAASSIAERIVKFEADYRNVTIEPTFSYVLPDEIVLRDDSIPKELIELIKGCYDPAIEDKHLGKDAWFGYSKCGLPLILEHNTPNNSISLLWADSHGKPAHKCHPMKPLFPRRKRHSSHG